MAERSDEWGRDMGVGCGRCGEWNTSERLIFFSSCSIPPPSCSASSLSSTRRSSILPPLRLNGVNDNLPTADGLPSSPAAGASRGVENDGRLLLLPDSEPIWPLLAAKKADGELYSGWCHDEWRDVEAGDGEGSDERLRECRARSLGVECRDDSEKRDGAAVGELGDRNEGRFTRSLNQRWAEAVGVADDEPVRFVCSSSSLPSRTVDSRLASSALAVAAV